VTLGLTPKPHSSGGKERLGTISKMGNRYIRRLLYLGAMATITARRRRPAGDDWRRAEGAPPARRDDAAQAGEVGRDRPGQPHGAGGLGAPQDRRELSGFARLRKRHGPDRSDEMVRRVALKARLRREGMMANRRKMGSFAMPLEPMAWLTPFGPERLLSAGD
jgi:hypothetical protein